MRKRRNGVSRGLSIVEDLDLDDLASSPPPPEEFAPAGASDTACEAAVPPFAGGTARSHVQAPADASTAPMEAPVEALAASVRAPDILIAAAPQPPLHDASCGDDDSGAGATARDGVGKLPSGVLDIAMAAPARVRKASVTLHHSAVGRLPRKLARIPRRASSRGVTPPFSAADVARSTHRRNSPAVIATSIRRSAEGKALGVVEAIDTVPMLSPRPPPRDGEAMHRQKSVREHAARIELQLLIESTAAAHHRTVRARHGAMATQRK